MTVQHEYYNDADARGCPALLAAPTPTTARQLAALGLLFRATPNGFDVLVGEKNAQRLPDRIWRSSNTASGGIAPPLWLTFLFQLIDPVFLSVTSLPLGARPGEQIFYVCNLTAHKDGGDLVLGPKSWLGAQAMVAVNGPRVARAARNGPATGVTDLSGSVIPRSMSIRAGWSQPLPSSFVADLTSQPYGLYTIEGQNPAQRFFYAPSVPPVVGAADILLAPPTKDASGVYPVPGPDARSAGIGGLSYQLRFKARRTYWEYFVAPQEPTDKLSEDLAVTGERAVFAKDPQARLPNGGAAVAFRSKRPLKLYRRSPYEFRLSGSRIRGDGSRGDVAVTRLPAAPATPVLPANGAKSRAPLLQAGLSEIYVYV